MADVESELVGQVAVADAQGRARGVRAGGQRFRRGLHERVSFCPIDYKELDLLRKFLTTSSKLMSRKRAGTSAQEQEALKRAIKRARYLALLPYSGT
ncbi:MAG TPA: 30S ribosomal protein S18 [Phycisphaerae bacterium]|nr:30S ribosomal protein S18 [Phycisphaerae bacterium]HNU46280.1 30S ribosomal protein S18 [Phycisphaerae bacterium]